MPGRQGQNPHKILTPNRLLVIIFFLTALAYSNTLFSPLTLDDKSSFVDSSRMYVSKFSFNTLKQLSNTRFGLSRFIPIATFAANNYFSHGRAVDYHLTNIVIHLLTISTLFFFLKNLFRTPQAKDKIKFLTPDTFAIAICGVWALNPVQTNAVTYLVQRMTSIATLFYLASLGFYIKARLSHDTKVKIIATTMAFFCAAASFLSKEISATLPLIILLIEFMFISPNRISKTTKDIQSWPWIIAGLIIAAILIIPILEGPFKSIVLNQYNIRRFTLGERLLTEARVVIWYISLLILPLPARMNLDHDVNVSLGLFSPPSTLISIISIVILISTAWKQHKKNPLLSLGIYWFFINLLIESTVIPLELIFEHRLYLPSIGIFIVLMVIFDKSLYFTNTKITNDKLNDLAILFILIVFSLSSILTTLRNDDWRNKLSIYRDCALKSPNKPRALANYGMALGQSGQYDKAITLFERAIKAGRKNYENYIPVASNIVLSTYLKGEKIQAIKKAKQLYKNMPEGTGKLGLNLFLLNLSEMYLDTGNTIAAYEFWRSASRLYTPDTNYKTIPLLLKIIKNATQSPSDAKGIGLDLTVPDEIAAQEKLASCLLDIKDYNKASLFINNLVSSSYNNRTTKRLKERLTKELRKNNAAISEMDIKRSKNYTKSLGYRWGMRTANFIIKHYQPLKKICSIILDKLAQDFKDDPFVLWYKLLLQKITPPYQIDPELIKKGISRHPNFIPFLRLQLAYEYSAGKREKALDTINKINTVYPGNKNWQNYEKLKRAIAAKDHI